MKYEIERIDNFGRGITYINNKICFVRNCVPKDIVELEITKETAKYIEADCKNIIVKSNDRIESKCKYFNECGGCCFQNYNYDKENEYKENKIRYLIKNKLKIDDSCINKIVYDNENYYRNKLTLHGNSGMLGLYRINTNDIISISECIISNKKINSILNKICDYEDIDELLIRTSNDLEEVLISIKGNINDYKSLLELCDVLIINDEVKTNKSSIITNLGKKKFYLSEKSFFQVNTYFSVALFDKVCDYIKKISPSTVLDLYCGTGTFGIYIADYAKKVIGVDYNEYNISDAINNKTLNDISNIEFICDKVENVISDFKNIDVIIVDPPRKGLDKKTREYIKKINPKQIIYISCDPNTMTRDLDELKDIYRILEVTPYNMFPRTYHCESVTVLQRKQ